MLIGAGQYLNLLARGTVTVDTSEDSLFTAANLYDGLASKPFRFSSSTSDSVITCDLNMMSNGGFETGNTSGWTANVSSTATNLVAVTSANPNAGTYSLVLTYATASTSDYCGAYQDRTFPTGERVNLTIALSGNTTTRLRVQCVETGGYLSTDATWGTTSAYAVVNPSTSYVTTTLTFTTPETTDARRATVTLRFQPIMVGATTAVGYADDIYVHPSANFLGVFGHDLGPIAPKWLASTDGVVATAASTVATMTPAARSFYSYTTTPVDYRYLHLLLSGVPHEAPWFGEVVAAQVETVGQRPLWGYETADSLSQARATTVDGGVAHVFQLADDARRSIKFSWTFGDASGWTQFHQDVLRRSEYGRWPVVVVPFTSESDVIYGHIGEGVSYARDLPNWRDAGSVVISEDPLPTWI